MLKTAIFYYSVRALWGGTGVVVAIAGVMAEHEDWHIRALLAASGLITLLMSLFFGGFMKHLAGHHAFSMTLSNEIDTRFERMFEILDKAQSKTGCNERHDTTMELMTAKLQSIENLVKMLNEHKG